MANQSKLSYRIVYVLKNVWYRDGLRKVGSATKMLGHNGRLNTLKRAGVPGNFEIVFAIVCEEEGKAALIEDALHTMWKEKNINNSSTGSQEWFYGISDAEYKAQFELLININGGKIQWWTKENDTPSGDEPDEEELSIPFDEVASIVTESSITVPSPPAPAPQFKYHHSKTTVDTYPLLTEKEKGAYQVWRRRAQGFFKDPWIESVKHLNRNKTMEWDAKRLSWVLLRDDYDWLTPELRSTLKDCF